jgi:hypothetical protein
MAYSVNGHGMPSYPSRFVYRMAEPGLPASAPRSDAITLRADPGIARPTIELQRGYSVLRMALPDGASFLVRFDTGILPADLADFEVIDASGGYGELRIPCPYSWSGDVRVYFGVLAAGVASFDPKPIAVHLSYPADEASAPAVPPSPVIDVDPLGRGGYLVFPSYDGDIFVSVGSDKPAPYTAPIPLQEGVSSIRASWYGVSADGRRSTMSGRDFELPARIDDVDLAGAAEGAAIAGDVQLRPAVKLMATSSTTAAPVLRYELRTDGSLPPEPGPASPALGDALSVACPPGEERSVVLRYRLTSGDSMSEGRILRFTLDRKPPEPPRFREGAPSYFDSAASLELAPGADGKDVFASISVDGAPAPFQPVAGPISFPGSEAGPVTYLVRAYDVDAAGNKSQEMKPFSFVVDKASVYVAEDGSEKGDGSPDRPYRSFDQALAVAIRGGKKNVNMRGALEMRTAVQLSRELNLNGGFDGSWSKDGSARALLRVAVAGGAAFDQRGASLTLRRLELRAENAGPGSLIALSDASFSAEDSMFVAGSDGDLILVAASRSKLRLADSRIQAARAMSFTAFSADGCEISIIGSSISASKGTRIFGAFDIEGGSLEIRQSLLESSSDLGLNLLSVSSASLLVDRSLINADGGSGFLRLGSFKDVSGEIKNSKVALGWKGPGTLFEIAGGSVAFRHDTIAAGSSKGALRFFDVKGGAGGTQIWNCILDVSGAGAEMARTELMPAAGFLAADCVWGFDKLLSGALETGDLASLNALNSRSALYSSKPIIAEPPESSFSAPVKNQAALRRSSACVGAALPLEKGYELDFGGHPRPAPGKDGPDIGADELSD